VNKTPGDWTSDSLYEDLGDSTGSTNLVVRFSSWNGQLQTVKAVV